MKREDLVFADTETTGLDPYMDNYLAKHRDYSTLYTGSMREVIIQVFEPKLAENGVLTIRPYKAPGQSRIKLHSYSNEYYKDRPEELTIEILAFLKNRFNRYGYQLYKEVRR